MNEPPPHTWNPPPLYLFPGPGKMDGTTHGDFEPSALLGDIKHLKYYPGGHEE